MGNPEPVAARTVDGSVWQSRGSCFAKVFQRLAVEFYVGQAVPRETHGQGLCWKPSFYQGFLGFPGNDHIDYDQSFENTYEFIVL